MKQYPILICYSDTSLNIAFIHNSDNDKPLDVLEEIFAEWNAGSGRECVLFTNNQCRSLSVGDFVRVNEEWYRCASFGWDAVTNEEVDRWFGANLYFGGGEVVPYDGSVKLA